MFESIQGNACWQNWIDSTSSRELCHASRQFSVRRHLPQRLEHLVEHRDAEAPRQNQPMGPRVAVPCGAQAELIGVGFSHLSIGSIQVLKGAHIMHPVSYLFEDIYRNYWGIAPASERPERHRLARLRRRNRELLIKPERRQD
ncbi:MULTISPECIES: hypothetical protein [unclassified Mesorhizobium]|uniref:hypothetical protein n=1 Tax=unclassified Mesorhizobium TaxID=325217 RepID=UPI0013DF2111|nr:MULTISPECIES: hypothetical protein [unclassified Mesorhizobium]